VPLNVHVLTALQGEELSLMNLRRAVGSPPSTTMRVNLRNLIRTAILERDREDAFPGSVAYRLGPVGRELLSVAASADNWLANAPNGPMPLGSAGSKSAIKALLEGWSTTIVRALAAQPLALTELNRIIQNISYPSLERRLAAMKLAGLVAACPGRGRGTPYAGTDWLREAAGPLTASARWERRCAPVETVSPLLPLDVEAFFLLALPALEVDRTISGSCRLAVDFGGSNGHHRVAGAILTFEDGRFVSCNSRLGEDATGWVSGSVTAWLDAAVAGETQQVEIGGDCRIATEVLDALHRKMASSPQLAWVTERVATP